MTQIEVGVQAGRVLLKLIIPGPDGEGPDLVTVPLSADEARNLVNGLGESIKCVATQHGVMT